MGGRDALLSGFVRPDNQKCAPVIARSRDGELENGQNMSKPFRRLVGPGFVLALIHYISVHAQASIVLRLTRLLSNGRQHEEL